MIEKLALNHNKWVAMAYRICKDSNITGDLVNDMYLKLLDKQEDVNDGYVYKTLRSLHFDYLKAEKKAFSARRAVDFEVAADSISYEEEPQNNPHFEIPKDCLTWAEKEILILRQTKSAKAIEKQYHINYRSIYRIEEKAKEKLTEWASKLKEQETL